MVISCCSVYSAPFNALITVCSSIFVMCIKVCSHKSCYAGLRGNISYAFGGPFGDISFCMRGLSCHGDPLRHISKKDVMYISFVS